MYISDKDRTRPIWGTANCLPGWGVCNTLSCNEGSGQNWQQEIWIYSDSQAALKGILRSNQECYNIIIKTELIGLSLDGLLTM